MIYISHISMIHIVKSIDNWKIDKNRVKDTHAMGLLSKTTMSREDIEKVVDIALMDKEIIKALLGDKTYDKILKNSPSQLEISKDVLEPKMDKDTFAHATSYQKKIEEKYKYCLEKAQKSIKNKLKEDGKTHIESDKDALLGWLIETIKQGKTISAEQLAQLLKIVSIYGSHAKQNTWIWDISYKDPKDRDILKYAMILTGGSTFSTERKKIKSGWLSINDFDADFSVVKKEIASRYTKKKWIRTSHKIAKVLDTKIDEEKIRKEALRLAYKSYSNNYERLVEKNRETHYTSEQYDDMQQVAKQLKQNIQKNTLPLDLYDNLFMDRTLGDWELRREWEKIFVGPKLFDSYSLTQQHIVTEFLGKKSSLRWYLIKKLTEYKLLDYLNHVLSTNLPVWYHVMMSDEISDRKGLDAIIVYDDGWKDIIICVDFAIYSKDGDKSFDEKKSEKEEKWETWKAQLWLELRQAKNYNKDDKIKQIKEFEVEAMVLDTNTAYNIIASLLEYDMSHTGKNHEGAEAYKRILDKIISKEDIQKRIANLFKAA